MSNSLIDRQGDAKCRNCFGVELVCENHMDRPWEGATGNLDACGCGAGAPCPVCQHKQILLPWQEAMSDILWMAREWFEHNGSYGLEGDENQAAINKAKVFAELEL